MVYSRCCAAVGAVCSLTVAVQVECVALYLEGIDVRNHFLDLLDAWITKLHDMVTIQTDQMIMLPKAEGGFIFGLRVSELMADYEVGIQKQTERIVDGRTTDRVFLLLQVKV